MRDIYNLQSDLFEAKKNRDVEKDLCLGTLLSECRNEKIRLGHALSNEEMICVAKKCVKKSQEARQFAVNAGRDDVVAKCDREIQIINEYIPDDMTEEEIERTVRSLIGDTTNKGQAMKLVMPVLRGKADGRVIASIVEKVISGR